ncbi:ABC transporter permease [[Clostridium] polysaccharolyticum]|jgi:sodium transport system permease protein|uniref:Sodium transport system permease protein n=1 Tax=[Clostridium] polysaccharolyticum TaxID=29364 RepID=A0A1I0FQ72_9FIRM|nr:ABC transporter permease [[Clostridium] polysaccharolyticum]SET59732.1 sodium transport system permease protein [[Clostridium] polysaccharolyticum]
MKSKVMTVVKKEFSRFFGDPRMVFSTLILPALMIYVLYSFMGDGLMNQFTVAEDYVSKVYIVNMPDSLKPAFDEMSLDIQKEKDLDKMKEDVQGKEADLLAVFPKDFDAQVAAYDNLTSSSCAPEVQLYYNSADTESSNMYTAVEEVLVQYEGSICNKFDINSGEQKYDLATDKDSTGMFFSTILPMLLLVFIFSGCMAIAPESIAGEKERGTIAKLLVSPTKRSDIALGKIISLSVLGLLCGTSSFIGTLLSMPKLMQGEASMSASVYEVKDYLVLLCVIFSTVLIIVGILSIVSAFAKTVKEATTYISPIMVVIILVGITSMFGNGTPKAHYFFLIPVYNSVQCMSGIFGFTYSMANVGITIGANLVVTAVLCFILSKMFNSEKVMFS